ncbi:MAG: hypothetical protein ACRBN8_33025 [Nannocystales bacterium]
MEKRSLSPRRLFIVGALALGTSACEAPSDEDAAVGYDTEAQFTSDSEEEAAESTGAEAEPPQRPSLDAVVDEGPTPLPSPDALATKVEAQAAGSITVEGKVFYNDLRSVGNFHTRRDKSGVVGTGATYAVGAENFLAARDVVADFYEVDALVGPGCESAKYIGSSTVNSWGEYSETFDDVETCAGEDQVPDIKVTYRLRFCNDIRCVSVEKDDQTTYKLAHPQASQGNPLQATPGTHTLNTLNYRTAWGDDHSMAANVYASIVDTTRVWHVDAGVPFYRDTYGETFVRFPSSFKSIATTSGPGQVHIPMPADWISGKGPMHEYGHTIQLRSWDGTTGTCTDYAPSEKYDRFGDDSWSADEREWPTPAFAEAWANYVQRMTTDTCTGGFDDNTSSLLCNADASEHPDANGVLITHAGDGKSYPRNITKALCDWSDDGANNDNDPNLPGSGDHFVASLYSTWFNMRNMYQTASDTNCLTMCDYSDYYVNVRKSAAAVGAASHADYESWISDLMHNNGMSCSLPTPSGF